MQTTAQITHIPVTQIERDALPRDRSVKDRDADLELYRSIMNDGLRQPIEVWAFKAPRGEYLYGLISGHRRLDAVQELAGLETQPDTIPAFIRTPETIPEAMANMVAENEIRAEISPWDRARIIVDAVGEGIFDTADAAIATLHPYMQPAKRRRLRATCQVVESFAGTFPDPHILSERKLLRLAAVLRADLEELIFAAIAHHQPKDTQAIWQVITPILQEAEQVLANPPKIRTPGRPRRLLSPKQGVQIRREYRPDGWALILTGKDVHDAFVEEVLDEVLRWFGGA